MASTELPKSLSDSTVKGIQAVVFQMQTKLKEKGKDSVKESPHGVCFLLSLAKLLALWSKSDGQNFI